MSDTRAETVSELADVFNKTDISGNSKPTGEDSDSTTEERKWVVPKKYDYDTYLNKSNGKASTVDNSRSWAANASRYEWDGEYGDVPPINSDLEETLFRRDFVVRGGENLSQLEVDVHQLSSVHVDPIKEVSGRLSIPTLPIAHCLVVQGRRSSSSYDGYHHPPLRV